MFTATSLLFRTWEKYLKCFDYEEWSEVVFVYSEPSWFSFRDLYDNEIESIEKQAFGELGSLKTL